MASFVSSFLSFFSSFCLIFENSPDYWLHNSRRFNWTVCSWQPWTSFELSTSMQRHNKVAHFTSKSKAKEASRYYCNICKWYLNDNIKMASFLYFFKCFFYVFLCFFFSFCPLLCCIKHDLQRNEKKRREEKKRLFFMHLFDWS